VIVDGQDRRAVEYALDEKRFDGELVFEADAVIGEGAPVEGLPAMANILRLPSHTIVRGKDAAHPPRISRASGARYYSIFGPREFDVHGAPAVEKITYRDLILDGGPDGRVQWPAQAEWPGYNPLWEKRHLLMIFGQHDTTLSNVVVDHPVADGVIVMAVWADERGWAVAKSPPTNTVLDVRAVGDFTNRNHVSVIEAEWLTLAGGTREKSSRADMPAADDFEPDRVSDKEAFPYQGYVAAIRHVRYQGTRFLNNKSNICFCAQFPDTLIEDVKGEVFVDRVGDYAHYGNAGGDPGAAVQWIEDADHSKRNGRIVDVDITQHLWVEPAAAPPVILPAEPVVAPTAPTPPTPTAPAIPLNLAERKGCLLGRMLHTGRR
jgi:hypothetical protein